MIPLLLYRLQEGLLSPRFLEDKILLLPRLPSQGLRGDSEGLRGSDPNGGVEVVGLGTNHRLSLAQNPVLLAGQIAILLAACNRDVARLRKRRQVAGRKEVRAGDSESRAQFGRTPRAVRQLLQDVVRHLVTALLQNVRDSLGLVLLEAGDIPPSCLLLLLIIGSRPEPSRSKARGCGPGARRPTARGDPARRRGCGSGCS